MSRLRVRLGKDLDSLTLVNPNDEETPFCVSSNEFTGFVMVRIKDFTGIVPDGCIRKSGSKYFEGKRHMFSLQVQGQFATEYKANDIVWAAEWERPIKVPNFFISFYQMVAPHSMVDFSGPRPYIQSFAVTASSVMQSWSKIKTSFVPNLEEDISSVLPPNLTIKRHKSFFSSEEANLVADRRKLFVVETNRKSMTFQPTHTIAFETFNSFFDPNTFRINIPPGLYIDLKHVLDGQPLRLILRSKDCKTQFLAAELSLE